MPAAPETMRRRAFALLALSAAVWLLASCAGYVPQGGEDVGKAHYQRYLAFRAQNQLDKAALELELAVKADPQLYHAYYELGLIYQSQGLPEKARVAWERGLAEARSGPDRGDYPRVKSIAEMETALASLQPSAAPLLPPTPAYQAPPPRTVAHPKSRSRSGVRIVSPPRWRGKLVSGKPAPARHGGGYAVLVSSNLSKKAALGDQKRLAAHGYHASISAHKDKKGKLWHRVWVGCCSSEAQARALAAKLNRKGLARGAQAARN